jgi:hypothetical protein
MKTRVLSMTLLATMAGHGLCWGNERHFTYSNETGVLNPGDAEIEPQTTLRYGRESYFSRWDNRFEFEFGLVENLQAALYWNLESVAADQTLEDGSEVRTSETKFASLSAELKYKLSDPVADAIGTGLYFESALGPTEAELEAKFLIDKRVGNLLFAANIAGEYEWEFEAPDETGREAAAVFSLGAGYFLADQFMLGLEARSKNEFEEAEELESSTLSLGPVAAVTEGGWWLTFTFLPQLVALKGKSDGSNRDLENAERFESRLILGLEL